MCTSLGSSSSSRVHLSPLLPLYLTPAVTAQRQIFSLIVAHLQLFCVRWDLRVTEGEDAEAKAFKCLGEGADSEEKGEHIQFGLKKESTADVHKNELLVWSILQTFVKHFIRSAAFVCSAINKSAQVRAELWGETEKTHKDKTKRSFLSKINDLKNTLSILLQLKFLYSALMIHCCRCSSNRKKALWFVQLSSPVVTNCVNLLHSTPGPWLSIHISAPVV